jgi:hypothetical protein
VTKQFIDRLMTLLSRDVIRMKVIEIGQYVSCLMCLRRSHARKQRLFLIRSMFRRSFSEVTKRSFDSRALLNAKFAALTVARQSHQSVEKLFDAPVAILEHANRIAEISVGCMTYFDRHGNLPLSSADHDQ